MGVVKGACVRHRQHPKYHTIFLLKVDILTLEAIDKAGGKSGVPKNPESW